MGPGGSGKTALLNVIGGLDEPSRGRLMVERRAVKVFTVGAVIIELAPTGLALRPGMTGRAEIAIAD